MVTARELAKRLGVSQSTISRAFSPHASIDPDMRERVFAAARSVGYTPNAIASALSSGRSRIVGIVMGGFQNPFYAMLLDRLSPALQEAGFQTLLFNVAPGEPVDSRLALLNQYHVDAVVIASATVDSKIARTLAASGRRAVLFNRLVPETDVPSVVCDNEAGAALVAEHFLSLRRRRVAFLAGPGDTATSVARERGFMRRVQERGMVLSGSARAADYSYEAGFAAAKSLAASPADALFCANDILALGAIDALKRGQGRDIAIAGFDDIPMAAWPGYSLTTVRQPLPAMVAATVEALRAALAGEAAAGAVLPGELVVRESSTKVTK